jgi:hypothetical protein
MGYPLTIMCNTLSWVVVSTVRSLIQRLADKVWQDLDVCPLCSSSGAHLCTYLRWFAHPGILPCRTSVLRLPLGLHRLRLFLRLYMGCLTLPSDAGWRQGVPRFQPVCPGCCLGKVGDERHLVFKRVLPWSIFAGIPDILWPYKFYNGPNLMAGRLQVVCAHWCPSLGSSRVVLLFCEVQVLHITRVPRIVALVFLDLVVLPSGCGVLVFCFADATLLPCCYLWAVPTPVNIVDIVACAVLSIFV